MPSKTPKPILHQAGRWEQLGAQKHQDNPPLPPIPSQVNPPLPPIPSQVNPPLPPIPVGNYALPNLPSLRERLAQLDDFSSSCLTQALQNYSNPPPNSFLSLQDAINKTVPPGHSQVSQHLINVLSDYNITYLGGGNSRNFLVVDLISGTKEVLKVEYRFGNPMDEVKRIQSEMQGTQYETIFVNTAAERSNNINIFDKRNKQLVEQPRILQVTEFCQSSDVKSQSLKCTSQEDTLKQCESIFGQMTGFLEAVNKNGAFHSDMKNSNWLVDDQGNLKIADTKAILPAPNGVVNFSSLSNGKPPYNAVNTKFMNPPEFGRPGDFSASKAQSFMLGKNIYAFLVEGAYVPAHGRRIDSQLNGISEATMLDFSAPIFYTLEGDRYRKLIESTVRQDPNQRLDISDVRNALDAIKSLKNNESSARDFLNANNTLIARNQDYPCLSSVLFDYKKVYDSPLMTSTQLDNIRNDAQNFSKKIDNIDALYQSLSNKYSTNVEATADLMTLKREMGRDVMVLQEGLERLTALDNKHTLLAMPERQTYQEHKQALEAKISEYPVVGKIIKAHEAALSSPNVDDKKITELASKLTILNKDIAQFENKYETMLKKYEGNQRAVDTIKATKQTMINWIQTDDCFQQGLRSLNQLDESLKPTVPVRMDTKFIDSSPDGIKPTNATRSFKDRIGQHRQAAEPAANINDEMKIVKP